MRKDSPEMHYNISKGRASGSRLCLKCFCIQLKKGDPEYSIECSGAPFSTKNLLLSIVIAAQKYCLLSVIPFYAYAD
ncbi:MAG: hypothetical protein DBX53_05105 [Clostridiales bacterium]|nr:MAG: hypothetical protein DBX53_05105 [Clostridiales bacterium]